MKPLSLLPSLSLSLSLSLSPGHPKLEPKSLADPNIAETYAPDYMFMGCIKYINSVSFPQINIMHVCVCMYKYPPSSPKRMYVYNACLFHNSTNFSQVHVHAHVCVCVCVCVIYLGACKFFIPSNTSFLYCACMCTSMYMYMYMYGHVHACVHLVPAFILYIRITVV